MSSRANLGVTEVEREIIRDRINNQACGGSTTIFEEYNQTFLDAFVEKRPHPSSITRLMKSNKRLRKLNLRTTETSHDVNETTLLVCYWLT